MLRNREFTICILSLANIVAGTVCVVLGSYTPVYKKFEFWMKFVGVAGFLFSLLVHLYNTRACADAHIFTDFRFRYSLTQSTGDAGTIAIR